MAAQLDDLTDAPVDYQDYASEAEELADLTADNRIAELATTDNKMLAEVLPTSTPARSRSCSAATPRTTTATS